MITDLILNITYWFLGDTILNILPDGTPVNPSLVTWMQTMGEQIRIFDNVIPIDIMYQMILLVIALELILQIWKIWNYVRTYIPFLH